MPARQAALTRARGDRGSVSVIAAAIAFPVIIMLLSACFQAGFWFAARAAALAAAQQGADTARVAGASLRHGETAACAFASSAAQGWLRDPECTGTGGTTIAITVCGNALSLLPGLPVRACAQARGARERFTTRTAP